MTAVAGQGQRNRRREGIQRLKACHIGNRATECQGAGLVDQGVIDFGQPFEGRPVLDKHAAPHQRARGNDLRHRHRQPERARASYDQHRNRDHQRMIDPGARHEPADKGQQGQRVHRRRIEPRSAVGDAHISGTPLPRHRHQPRNFGQRSVLTAGADPHIDRIFQIERARQHRIARIARHRRAFAGQQ